MPREGTPLSTRRAGGEAGGAVGGAGSCRLLGREESAFWTLSAVTQRLLPLHYLSDMAGVRTDSLVLVALLRSHPTLSPVLDALLAADLDPSLFSTQWFLLAFLNALPTETTLRVWDLFLVIGPAALFAAALAVLSLLAPRLRSARGFEEAYTTIKAPQAATLDADAFARHLVRELADLPPARLLELRAVESRAVQRENEARAKARAEREARPDARAAAAAASLNGQLGVFGPGSAARRAVGAVRRVWWAPLLVAALALLLGRLAPAAPPSAQGAGGAVELPPCPSPEPAPRWPGWLPGWVGGRRTARGRSSACEQNAGPVPRWRWRRLRGGAGGRAEPTP